MVNTLDPEDIKAFEPEAKIGLLATLDAQGRPHLTLITTLRARGPRELVWGQFCEGLSKANVRGDPRTAFLIMSLQREIWRGKATWTGALKEGADFVAFNQLPMFRYNSYFGVHTAHTMDLVELTDRRKLFLPAVVARAVLSILSARAGSVARRVGTPALKPWALQHLASPSTLKFLAVVEPDGYPAIIPIVPAHPLGADSLLLGPLPSRAVTGTLEGREVALFALNLQMESVLIRGRARSLELPGASGLKTLEIEWVYNSMPPLPGQVYPPVPLEPVRRFD